MQQFYNKIRRKCTDGTLITQQLGYNVLVYKNRTDLHFRV